MKTIRLTRKAHLLVAAAGLLLALLSLAALGYALWPVESLREVAPLAPTLFAPP